MLDKIRKIGNEIDYNKLACVHTKVYDFNIFKRVDSLTRSLYHGKILIEQTKKKQYEMRDLIMSLRKYRPHIRNKIRSKTITLHNAEKIFNGREMIINALEDDIFPLPKKPQHKEGSEKKKDGSKKVYSNDF